MERHKCDNTWHTIEHIYDGMEILWRRVEHVEKLFEETKTIIEVLSKHSGAMQKDISEIAKWRKGIKILADQSKKPSKCPVCEGRGKDKNLLVMGEQAEAGIYFLKKPDCHACNGKGIVWG